MSVSNNELETQLNKPAVEGSDYSAPDNCLQVRDERKTARELKEQISFSKLLVREGRVIRKGGRSMMCCCPFHDDSTPSFSVFDDDSRAKCYGCGWYGDIFEYLMKRRKLDFYEAFKRLEKEAKYIQRTSPLILGASHRSSRIEQGPAISCAQAKIQNEAAKRLASDDWLCGHVAGARNWKPETIKKLAEEGCLGWYQGALAFNYPTGMKLRDWPSRRFLWEFGSQSVWRPGRLKQGIKVLLTEGETDAISLIDNGVEDDSQYSVIALPSATCIPSDLCDLLKGFDVTLCMDNDQAGLIATDKLCALLEPVCANLSFFDFEEVGHE